MCNQACYTANCMGFCSGGNSVMCKKVLKTNGFRHFNRLISSFPASATPNEVDRNYDTVRKRVWISEWVVMSCQIQPRSQCHCCFSSGLVRSFRWQKKQTKKQTEVGEGMQPPRRQNKNMERWDVSEAGNLKLDFVAKSIGINFFGFEYIFRYYSDKKQKTLLVVWTLSSSIFFTKILGFPQIGHWNARLMLINRFLKILLRFSTINSSESLTKAYT